MVQHQGLENEEPCKTCRLTVCWRTLGVKGWQEKSIRGQPGGMKWGKRSVLVCHGEEANRRRPCTDCFRIIGLKRQPASRQSTEPDAAGRRTSKCDGSNGFRS